MSRTVLRSEGFPLDICSHWGGKEYGRYLSVRAEEPAILRREQVERLVLVLNEWLAEGMRG